MLGGFVGLAYSAYEIVEIKGWALGFPIVIVVGLLSYCALEVLYPMWFGHDGGQRNGNR